eukprot:UN4320
MQLSWTARTCNAHLHCAAYCHCLDSLESLIRPPLVRPEKRAVIVAHQNMIQYAGGYVDMPGGVESRILLQNGALSTWTHDPFCFGAL